MHLLRSAMTFAGCWMPELEVGYQPLREIKQRAGKVATKDQLVTIITEAMANEYWQLAVYCAAVVAGTGCRGGEIRIFSLGTLIWTEARSASSARLQRTARSASLGSWHLRIGGMRQLLLRAQALGATEPQHYLLPLSLTRSRSAKDKNQKFDVNRPMTGWVKSWRKLTQKCNMDGFRFHDLRHTFRTLGAEAGVPLEVMMAQLGHMDRETSLEYVHIQQQALERAKQLTESEQAPVLAAAQISSGAADGSATPKV